MLKSYRLDMYSSSTSGQSEGKQGNILIHKKACEIIQKIGKIEEIQMVDGERIRIVILRAIIGSG